MEDFYTLLELDKNTATENDIKRSFRKKALLYHPDRNVNNDTNRDELAKKFNDIKLAYDTLIDPEKKKMYDLYGKDSVMGAGGGGGGGPMPFDFDIGSLFQNMSMGGGMPGMPGMPPGMMPQFFNRQERLDIDVEVILTLEELYNGTDKNIEYTRNIICNKCKGSGAMNDNAILTCTICNGNGMKTLSKGFAQIVMTCDSCQGKGKTIKNNMYCKSCDGAKIMPTTEEITTKIKPSIDMDKPIKIKKLGHYGLSKNRGDLNIHIQLLKHDVFTKKGRDLYMKKSIDLYSSLFGAKFIIKHLDDSKLYISHKDIIPPNSKRVIYGKGMEGGNLIIEFTVIFPKSIDANYKRQLSKILHRQREQLDIDNNDKITRVDLQDYYENEKREEDDYQHEFDGQPHNIECATQ